MNVKRIIVDELPEICNFCQFEDILDYVGCHFCYAKRKSISREKNYNLSRPSWCPLVIDECCEWHGEYGGYDEHGDMIFFARKTGCSDSHIQKVSVVDYTYCPNCGRKIKYVEVE